MTTGSKTFGQDDPRWFCPHRHSPIYSGGSYPRRHRCPRCSKQCHDAWAAKEYATVSCHLQRHLPAGCTVFRGHLHMPQTATVQDHADTRRRFMHALRCLKSRLKKKYTDLVLELRAYSHPTSPDAQHYDFLCFSSLPQDELRQHLRTLWRNAGGRG